MEKIKTATQKEFDCDYFNYFLPANRVYIRVLNKDLATVAAVFSDPAETTKLWWCDKYVARYTKLIALVPEGNAIRVVLGKE